MRKRVNKNSIYIFISFISLKCVKRLLKKSTKYFPINQDKVSRNVEILIEKVKIRAMKYSSYC